MSTASPVRRKLPIHERSILVGDIVVVNGHGVNHTLLTQRLAEGDYQVQETPHFFLFTRCQAPRTILVHRFASDTPPGTLEHCVTTELQPLGFFQQPGDQKALLQGLLDSLQVGEDIPLRERSLPVGELIVMNGTGLNLQVLKRRFLLSGYRVQETPHFFYCTRQKAPSSILVHWFAPDDLHTNISRHLVEEMRPFGCVPNSRRQGEILTGIVGTTLPGDIRRAWHYFGVNTFQHLIVLVSTAAPHVPYDWGTLEATATLYQRVLEVCAGKRFLDAGCNSGFFALLLAERRPFVQEVVGVDIDSNVFRAGEELAHIRNLSTVRFVQADLLSEEIDALGPFDTVTALHVLEHFTEAEMYRVLDRLLRVTAQHLIVAVPYEETPTAAYDHLQCFSHEKLEQVGRWCLEHLGGAGQMWCEEMGAAGNLLVIERLT